jgi:hypothetical protein
MDETKFKETGVLHSGRRSLALTSFDNALAPSAFTSVCKDVFRKISSTRSLGNW